MVGGRVTLTGIVVAHEKNPTAQNKTTQNRKNFLFIFHLLI
jgi:hypothetical protein